MIERVLEQARRRGVSAADVYWQRVERTTLAFEWGRLKSAGAVEEAGINLRVVHGARVGIAGSTAVDASPDELVSRALQSAELGETLALSFPARAPLPTLATYFDRAANASLDDLVAIGHELVGRLAREGCQVNVSIERAVGDMRLVNSAGTDAGYRSTAVGVSADVWRVAGDDVLAIGDSFDGADLPEAADVGALAQSIKDRLEPAFTIVAPPEGALPVVFTPAGLSAVLLPITQALSGKAVLQGISPLGAKVGEQVFDRTFSVTDDALVSGRPRSRPMDDEGVPSRAVALVEHGVVRAFIYDLETAARAGAGAVSTGHGHRGIFGKPSTGFTNLIVGEGGNGKGEGYGKVGGGLVANIQDGLLVDDLIGVGQGNVIGGAFSHPVALAYRIQNGEITGRVKDAAVAGNSYELLKSIGDWGSDGKWLGSRYGPSVMLEGVSVARR